MSDHTMSSATMTDMPSSHMTQHSGTMGGMPMSTGGSMSNATATSATASSSSTGGTEETQVPALGAGVMSGVSVSSLSTCFVVMYN